MELNENGFDPNLLAVVDVHNLVGQHRLFPAISRHARRVYFTESLLSDFADKRFFEGVTLIGTEEMEDPNGGPGVTVLLLQDGDKQHRMQLREDRVVLIKQADEPNPAAVFWLKEKDGTPKEDELQKAGYNEYHFRFGKEGELTSVLPKLVLDGDQLKDHTLLDLVPWYQSDQMQPAIRIDFNLVNNRIYKTNEYNFLDIDPQLLRDGISVEELTDPNTPSYLDRDLGILFVNSELRWCEIAVTWRFGKEGVKSPFVNLKDLFE